MTSEPSLPPFPPAWRTVALGTKCLSIGVMLLFVGIVLLPIFVGVQHFLLNERYTGEEIRARGVPMAPVLAGLLFAIVGVMAWLTGLCLCALAPPESGLRSLALSGAFCVVLFVVMVMQTSLTKTLGFVSIHARDPREVQKALFDRHEPQRAIVVNEVGFGASAVFLVLAASVLTSCSLCAIANHFHNAGLAQRLHRFIVYQLAAIAFLVVLGFLYLCVTSAWPKADAWLAVPFVMAALIDLTVGCSWLLRILKNVRTMLSLAEENAKPLNAN